MKELYVSLETAKIAKDCGFDLDVFKLYYEWEGGARMPEDAKDTYEQALDVGLKEAFVMIK